MTCPAGENETLSPEKVAEIVENRLSQQDMTSEGGCSVDFQTSLKCFLDEYVTALKKARERFGLIESLAGMENSATVEKIVLHISGVTARQLEVLIIVSRTFNNCYIFPFPFPILFSKRKGWSMLLYFYSNA